MERWIQKLWITVSVILYNTVLFTMILMSCLFLMYFQKKSLGMELYEQVFYHLDLVEKDYFGLQYTDHTNVSVSMLGLISHSLPTMSAPWVPSLCLPCCPQVPPPPHYFGLQYTDHTNVSVSISAKPAPLELVIFVNALSIPEAPPPAAAPCSCHHLFFFVTASTSTFLPMFCTWNQCALLLKKSVQTIIPTLVQVCLPVPTPQKAPHSTLR